MAKGAAACVVLVLLMAGCMGAGEGEDAPPDGLRPDDEDGFGTTVPGVDPTALPLWAVGDWWSYRIEYASGESYTARLLVHDEDGSHYHVTSDDRGLILRAALSHYPTIGAVAKADLSQTIHGDKVEALRFPMANETWSGTYRDFPATWTTAAAPLNTGKGDVDGYVTTIRNDDDGRVRISSGWSAATKWFTNFTFDFDGIPPADVTFSLLDWGSGHTGDFPILEIIDNIHGPFPTLVITAPDPADLPQPPDLPGALATLDIQEGSSILWGFFAVAGGPGFFRMQMGHESSGQYHEMEWQPAAAGGILQWEEVPAPDAGEWGLSATGAAQDFALLFVEAHEVRTGAGTL